MRYSDFVLNPHREIERVYDAAGLELSIEARDGMTRWVAEHPRKDLQLARPADLSPYGLDPAHARARFADYCEAFDVEIDGI